jgi:hypothetical protein
VIVLLLCALVTVVVLWATGRQLWGGPFDPNSVGSLGEWASGIGTVLAIYLAYRQFSAEQKATRDAEHRAEALRVTAWVTWSDAPADGVPPARAVDRFLPGRWQNRARSADPRTVDVFNGASSTLFDWSLFVIPSRGWGTYVQLSARSGPLHPGVPRSVRLSAPPPTATVRQVHSDGFPMELGAPRFVVLSFNDAWGQGWVRTNGDLQRLPTESRFLPVLLHLRNPAMPWAGVIDEATWKAFHEAAGNPAILHEQLVDLLPNPQLPWLTLDKMLKLRDIVRRQTLRQRGMSSYTYHPRAIQRRVQRTAAFNEVQQFFELTTRSDKFEVLYLKGG